MDEPFMLQPRELALMPIQQPTGIVTLIEACGDAFFMLSRSYSSAMDEDSIARRLCYDCADLGGVCGTAQYSGRAMQIACCAGLRSAHHRELYRIATRTKSAAA